MASTADPTDPGTRRPVEPAIAESGDNFEAVQRPLRKPTITCSAPDNAYSLFALFFPHEQLQVIADNINKNAINSWILAIDEGNEAEDEIWEDYLLVIGLTQQ